MNSFLLDIGGIHIFTGNSHIKYLKALYAVASSYMRKKIFCKECGFENYKIEGGQHICLGCGVEIKDYHRFYGEVNIDRGTTARNLNRIRRFNTILNILSDKLDLTEEQITKVRRLIANLLHDIGRDARLNKYLFVAYSIWYVLRMEGIPIALNDIISITNTVFNKRYRVRHVNRLLHIISRHARERETYIHLNVRDYIDYFFDRMALEKNIEYKDISKLRESSIYINEILNLGSRITNPRISAAVSILLAITKSKIFDNTWSMDDISRYIAELLGISHYTLRKRVRGVLRGFGLIENISTVYT